LIPPPYIGDYAFPPGRQVPLVTKNESWSFPKNFHLGVAGAAFQIEGAAKADGKGPSTWDVNMHRVPNFVADNSTGDITDNNYYMYKQGKLDVLALHMQDANYVLYRRYCTSGSYRR
jgi:hypothetical protein